MAFLHRLPVTGGCGRDATNTIDGTRWDRSIPTAGVAQPDAATSVLQGQLGNSIEAIPLHNHVYNEQVHVAERLTSEICLDDKSIGSVSQISRSMDRYANRQHISPDTSAYNRLATVPIFLI